MEAAVHKQGTYALQKVLESPCTASEFVALGNELLKSGRELLGSEPGIYVMAKLVEQLVSVQVCSLILHKRCVQPSPAVAVQGFVVSPSVRMQTDGALCCCGF